MAEPRPATVAPSLADRLPPQATAADAADVVAAAIEAALEQTLDAVIVAGSPPRLAAAMRHAVFPAGARVRPRLCLAVARACGGSPASALGAAVALELLHCASLVHDDLPCFDDAPLRRGRPSVHAAYGERLAVLAGDALIVLAFQALAQHAQREQTEPQRLARLLATVARAVGMPFGIAAGQAWECEPAVLLADYQQAKTGALFAAASVAGAQAAGGDGQDWRAFGEYLGEAYQVADDIRDAAGSPEWLGKPVGRDQVLGRPSAVRDLGPAGALRHFHVLLARVLGSIPPCPGDGDLRRLVREQAERLVPQQLCARLLGAAAQD